MNDPRPPWEEWAAGIALAVAQRGDCTRSQVGAVIMDRDNRMVATGYNGAPAGSAGCLSDGACPRGQSNVEPGSSYDTGPGACIAIHAEANAIIRASWADMKGSTLFVTREPCQGCWKIVNATPLDRVVWPGGEQKLAGAYFGRWM